MAASRLVGSYPVIGIRPTIDGRQGYMKVRESLEVQTMNMAKRAAALFRENLFYSNGEPVNVVIADSTIGRAGESAACADKFRRAGVDITLTVTVQRPWTWIRIQSRACGDLTERRDPVPYISPLYWLPMRRRGFRLLVSMDMMSRMLMIQVYLRM